MHQLIKLTMETECQNIEVYYNFSLEKNISPVTIPGCMITTCFTCASQLVIYHTTLPARTLSPLSTITRISSGSMAIALESQAFIIARILPVKYTTLWWLSPFYRGRHWDMVWRFDPSIHKRLEEILTRSHPSRGKQKSWNDRLAGTKQIMMIIPPSVAVSLPMD